MRRLSSSRAPRRWLSGAAAAALLWSMAAPAAALKVGDRAPQFAARALDGKENLSLAKFRGKVVYLDFWASWCGPCAKSLPVLEQLRKEFPEEHFQVLAINVDKDVELARQFLKSRPVGYPSASDPEGRLPEVFGIPTMPTSFLIDREGVIRYVHPGFREGDADELRSRIRSLLETQ
jgi:thiol-disulfide isomerase/thioredoxin